MLATIDQRRFADGTLDITDKPLWSGLKDVGVHPLTPGSRIIVRSGSTARPTTADVVVIAPADSTWHPVRHLRDPVNASGNVERFPPVVAHAVRFTSLATNSKREPCIDELEVWTAIEGAAPSENVALATAGARCSSSGNYANDPKHRLEHVNDGRYGNPRSWISNTLARGWVRIDFKAAARIDTIKWARDRQRRYADRLATSYVIGALVGERWVRVASSADRVPFGVDGDGAPMLRLGHLDRTITGSGAGLIEELRVVEAELAGLRRRPQVYAGRFVEPPRTRLLYRGDPAEPRGDVAPDVPAVLGTLALAPASRDRDRRHALAGAITDPRNPLTARVVVNRIWLHHFGEGLVDTPNDLGRMGTAPTHPELLDWLAAELMDHAWSVKHIQKLILSSAVWMQASAPRPEGDSVDASTRLLWRFPPRRLESEAIRDGMLRVSGELDLTMGGPGFDLFEPSANYVRVYEPRKAFGKDGLRRMVYARVVRMERDGTFGAFDTPDAGQVCPKRTRSTTALQALNLLNAPFVLKRADAFANRLRRERGDDVATQVRHAFALAFSRAPDQKELDESVGLVTNHGLSAFCRALLNTSEFLFIP
ncbi:MAG: hypothetical protein CMJ83_17640 [Planctomycetes bacterium]|nr:hypothetical protein [Planctomycetota bacterium]